MVRSNASTPDEYLAELPPDRRAVISGVRDVIRANLPDGFRESMNWGMLSYEVPLERYPDTYNGKPLGYIALAAQKNYNALYLFAVYQDPAREASLRAVFDAAGKKLDMGKSCVRFRSLDDLPLEAIGEAVAATTPDELIAIHEAGRARA